MKKNAMILLAAASITLAYGASDKLWLSNGNVTMGIEASDLDSISIDKDGNLQVATLNNGTQVLGSAAGFSAKAAADDATDEVVITYNGDEVSVVNPYAFNGVQVTTDGADVVVNADTEKAAKEVVYRLTGKTTTGSFKIYSTYKLEILLDNADITNDNGAAINIQTGKRTTIRVPEGTTSTLCDSKKYSTPGGEDEKATIFSEGQIEFRAKGTLNVTGTKKHAICSDDYVDIKNTKINILSAASDGIHANDYVTMQSGTLTMTNLGGDGIDADDEGYITMEGGKMDITIAADSSKGLKASGGAITVKGGELKFTMTGNTVIKDNEPSYCSAIKVGKDFTMEGGDINITSTGEAGKGISVDGNAYFNGGAVKIDVSGKGGTFTTASSTTDSYAAKCINVEKDAVILGGEFTLDTQSTATGGKCLKVDGTLVIGDENQGPTIKATTRGNQFSVGSGNTGYWAPGGGGMGGGGGWNNNSDHCNPKVIRVGGNFTINNGDFDLASTATTEGGECLESKATLNINGGNIACTTYDDCINATTAININGGNIYCYSTNNDAIDSNGKLTVAGGVIIALGARSPECGLDCDANSNFTLKGGTIVAAAGSNNTPSGSGTSQRVVYTSTTLNTSTDYTFTDASGNFLLNFRSPINFSYSANFMVSSPSMTSTGQSVKMYTGATVSGGDTFHGLTTGASYTGGSLKSTLTTR
jgi:hypothetical protein